MTQVISRIFETENLAKGIVKRLRADGVPQKAMRVVAAQTGESEADLAARLGSHDVAADAAQAYAKHISAGKNVAIVVHATHRPLGVAKLTREMLDSNDPIDAGDVTEESYVPDAPGSGLLSILDGHPHFLTTPVHKRRPSHGLISHGLGPGLLSPRKPRKSAIRGGMHMSRFFWPMRLVSSRKRRLSVGSGQSLSRLLRLPTLMARR